MGCNGSEFGVILRYIGLSAAVSAFLLLFGPAILSKKPLNRWIHLATLWLIGITAASSTASIQLCKGQAPWTILLAIQSVLLVAFFIVVCCATYRQISRWKRGESPDDSPGPGYSLRKIFGRNKD
ncbi:MAG: hypothetical protein ABSC48_03865 [Terracidiphilus sp.]|jgi:uncharacterized membrane protein AbrB (regulator of aidB expression)